MIAPRRPSLKSYSSFIDSHFVAGGPSGWNQPNCVASVSIDHNHDTAQVIEAQCDPSLLALTAFVFTGDCMRIIENGFDIGEGNAMFSPIVGGFIRVL
jgi:hypothetical protein